MRAVLVVILDFKARLAADRDACLHLVRQGANEAGDIMPSNLCLLLSLCRDQDFAFRRIGPCAQQLAQRQRGGQCGLSVAASDRQAPDVDAFRKGPLDELLLVGSELHRLTGQPTRWHL